MFSSRRVDRPGVDDPADQAGSLVTEEIRSLIAAAESNAAEVRSQAEQEAEGIRQQASTTAARALERITAIETQVGELVEGLRGDVQALESGGEPQGLPRADEARSDLAREAPADSEASAEVEAEDEAEDPPASPEPSADVDASVAVESDAEAETDESPTATEADSPPEAEPEAEAVETDAAGETDEDAEAGEGPDESARTEMEPEEGVEAGTVVPETVTETRRRRGLLGRLRGRGSSAPGALDTSLQCAVCQRSAPEPVTEDNLRAEGWHLRDGAGICPQCRGEGWRLPG